MDLWDYRLENDALQVNFFCLITLRMDGKYVDNCPILTFHCAMASGAHGRATSSLLGHYNTTTYESLQSIYKPFLIYLI